MTSSILTPRLTPRLLEERASQPVCGAFSIAERCGYRGIGPATVHNRRRFGEMAAVLKIGRHTLFTVRANAGRGRRREAVYASGPAPKSARRR